MILRCFVAIASRRKISDRIVWQHGRAFFSHRISNSILASLVDVRCSSQDDSSNNFPRLTNIDHIDVVVLVLDPDVLAYISLNFAHVVAIRTLESRLSAALISQMAGQVSLPSEYASTVGIRAGVLASFHEAIRALMTPQRRRSIVPWKRTNRPRSNASWKMASSMCNKRARKMKETWPYKSDPIPSDRDRISSSVKERKKACA